jgi:hypothetical protein
MAKIITKIKGKKVNIFKARIAKIEGNIGILRDGRIVKKDKKGKWIYEPN